MICEPFTVECGVVLTMDFHPDIDERANLVRLIAEDYADVYVPFQHAYDKALERRADPAYWAYDGVHPTPAGHQIMAGRLANGGRRKGLIHRWIRMKVKMQDTEHDAQTYAVIGAAMAVHNALGHGFLEAVYQDALEIEFARRGIPYQREVQLPITYCGQVLNTRYRADFITHGEVVVELKAQSGLTGIDQGHVLNYLKATGHHRSLLLNFGAASLQYQRLVF